MERINSLLTKLWIVAAITTVLLLFSDYILLQLMEMIIDGNPGAFEPLVAGLSLIVVSVLLSQPVMRIADFLWQRDTHMYPAYFYMISASFVSMVGGLIGYTDLPIITYIVFGLVMVAVFAICSGIHLSESYRATAKREHNPSTIWG